MRSWPVLPIAGLLRLFGLAARAPNPGDDATRHYPGADVEAAFALRPKGVGTSDLKQRRVNGLDLLSSCCDTRTRQTAR